MAWLYLIYLNCAFKNGKDKDKFYAHFITVKTFWGKKKTPFIIASGG